MNDRKVSLSQNSVQIYCWKRTTDEIIRMIIVDLSKSTSSKVSLKVAVVQGPSPKKVVQI